jgi:hypothetical protein
VLLIVVGALLAAQTRVDDASEYLAGNGWILGSDEGTCLAISSRNSNGTVITIGKKPGEDGVGFILANGAWRSLKERSRQPVTLHFERLLYSGALPADSSFEADASIEKTKDGTVGKISFVFDDETFRSLQTLDLTKVRFAFLSGGKLLTDYISVYGRVGQAIEACDDPFRKQDERRQQ